VVGLRDRPASGGRTSDGLAAIEVADTALFHMLAMIETPRAAPGPRDTAHTLRTLIGLANGKHRGVAVFGGEPGVRQAYDLSGRYIGGIGDCRWGSDITTPCGPLIFGNGTRNLFAVMARLRGPGDATGASPDERAMAAHVTHIESIRNELGTRRELLVASAVDHEVELAVLEIAQTLLQTPIPSSLASFLA
jgi:hypothetical protein